VFDVRWLAAEGLIRIGAASVVPVLRAIIVNREPDWLWEGVRHVVHDLAQGELEPILSPVRAAFDSVDYRIEVPLEARKALQKLGFETDA
jgi:hypothetical protein